MTEIDPRRGFESEACSIYHIYNRDSKFIDLSYVPYQVILQKLSDNCTDNCTYNLVQNTVNLVLLLNTFYSAAAPYE